MELRARLLLESGYPKMTYCPLYDSHIDMDTILWAFHQGFVEERSMTSEVYAKHISRQCITRVVQDITRENAAVVIQRAWLLKSLNPYTHVGRRCLIRRSLKWHPVQWSRPFSTRHGLLMWMELQVATLTRRVTAAFVQHVHDIKMRAHI